MGFGKPPTYVCTAAYESFEMRAKTCFTHFMKPMKSMCVYPLEEAIEEISKRGNGSLEFLKQQISRREEALKLIQTQAGGLK
jgi:hypothetical protein